MKRLTAALIGFMIFCLTLSAVASDLDDDFAEAFEGFRVDPFADIAPDFEDALEDFDDDSIYDAFTGDADFEDELDPFGNAFMSYDSSAAEDEEDPFAEPGDGSAETLPDAEAPAGKGSGSLKITIEDEALEMKFDASPTYSSIDNHLLQAAFYTYGVSSGNLYELYLTFPDSVQTGETITPESAVKSALDTALMLMISTATEDTLYVASQQSTSGPYPKTSTYTLRFDSVTDNGDTLSYTGAFTADLVSLSTSTGNVDKTLHVEDASFEFTIAKSAGGDSEPDDAEEDDDSDDPFDGFADLPSLAPEPTPTLEPDFRRV